MKSLDYVLAMVQADLEDFSPHGRNRYLQFVINAYKEHIAFKNPIGVKTVDLTINEAGVANLPYDFETYASIGVVLSDGSVAGLTKNADLPVNITWDGCGDVVITPLDSTNIANNEAVFPQEAGLWYFASRWRGGQNVGEMYASRGGLNQNGYFNIDYLNRVLQVYNVPMSTIRVQYISNQIDTATIVEDAGVPVVRWGAHTQIALFDRTLSQADKERFNNNLKEALMEYRHFKLLFTKDEYLDGLWGATYSTPKR